MPAATATDVPVARRWAFQSHHAVAPSSTTNRPAAAPAARRDIGGSKRSTFAMSNGTFGNRAATSSGRQPGGSNHTRSLSDQRFVCQLSWASPAYTCRFAHRGFQLRSGPRLPYTHGSLSTSSWNVPKRRSHTIRMPP